MAGGRPFPRTELEALRAAMRVPLELTKQMSAVRNRTRPLESQTTKAQVTGSKPPPAPRSASAGPWSGRRERPPAVRMRPGGSGWTLGLWMERLSSSTRCRRTAAGG